MGHDSFNINGDVMMVIVGGDGDDGGCYVMVMAMTKVLSGDCD